MFWRGIPGRFEQIETHLALLIPLILLTFAWTAANAVAGPPIGTADIRVLGLRVDVDTRPDVDGFQSVMTAVKDIPAAVDTFVGISEEKARAGLPPGWLVKADLSGPAFSDGLEPLSAVPNQPFCLPLFKIPGTYRLFNIRLEDGQGNHILDRDPLKSAVTIDVIDKLLVTRVIARPLTAKEIEERGIVIDEDNFTAVNFSVGLTMGSEPVEIELPMLMPTNRLHAAQILPPSSGRLHQPAGLDRINIPNFSVVGFTLREPPEEERQGIRLPPVSGVIIIPGNIAFLNQFFSVILEAGNAAPVGSGLTLTHAAARIALPLGEDGMRGMPGDDPLRIAETRGGGIQEELSLRDAAGSDDISPGGTNQAEFLVEGLREGSHPVNFTITGELNVLSLDEPVTMTGKAAGVVQVKNPTYGMTLAHPDVVREGEAYSVFVTVTNTSRSPANYFRLKINTRSLSGARPADGETGERNLDTLPPGEAETFEYRLVARTTGKVTGTVFLADEGINGSFVLNTGVGDTGIPLSPDSLILPQTVDYLPDDPDLVFAAVRLLGQAYSVATAPAGSLPPDISRISKSHVFDRAVKLAQSGLHIRFGEAPDAAVQDILLDYMGNDLGRLKTLYDSADAQKSAEKNMRSFDDLRRTTDAGKNFSEVIGELLAAGLSGDSITSFQREWAEHFASRPSHLSYATEGSQASILLRMVDDQGRILGGLAPQEKSEREIPFADRFSLVRESGVPAEMLWVAAPVSESYIFEFWMDEGAGGGDICLILPSDDGMKQVLYDLDSLPGGSSGKMVWDRGNGDLVFSVDTDGDEIPDGSLHPLSEVPIHDNSPALVGVVQWAKGDRPMTMQDFATGDPLGRMVGVLFSEEITIKTAENIDFYRMPAHRIDEVSVQPDRRMVFLMLDTPAGSLVDRELSVGGLADMRGNIMSGESLALVGSSERGLAGTVSGTARGPDGSPVPYARIRYIQPVHHPSAIDSWTRDLVVSTISADAAGRYQIDFVLKSGFDASEIENGDTWLNEAHASATNHFKLEAMDLETGNVGKASTRIQYEGQRMRLDVIIRGYGKIEGTVVDEEGNVVIGGAPGVLPVLAKNISTGETCLSWVDASGRYAFPAVYRQPDGTSQTAPELPVGNIVVQIVRTTDAFTGLTTVNIPATGETVEGDIVLVSPTRYGTVSGRVLEGDGMTGAAHVQVQAAGKVLTDLDLYKRRYKTGVVASAFTDEAGFFRFENVPAGDIELRAVRPATYEQADAKSYLGEEKNLHLTLVFPGSGGIIRGYVEDALGRKVTGANVGGVTETDDHGYFEITGLPSGNYRVSARGPGSYALGSVSVDILSSDDIQEILVLLPPVGTIQGTVVEADGRTLIFGQKVQLWKDSKGVMAETYTNASGEYAFMNVPVSRYDIRAVREDHGDGGMAVTAVRYAGDVRDADVQFRGMGEIRGRAIQSNGTPVVTDLIVTRKVWRIITESQGGPSNYYMDYVFKVRNEVDAETAASMEEVLEEAGVGASPVEYFMLVDEPVHISSDIMGAGGEVTGRFHFEGPATGGPFTVTAFGPFLAPTEVAGEIPRTIDPIERIIDVGDIVLVPTTGEVTGTVFLPDGITPVGSGVSVAIRSFEDSGTVRLPEGFGGSVSQPVLPSYDVRTDENGRFHFPLVLRGRFILNADTGNPDSSAAARTPAAMETERFYDEKRRSGCDPAEDSYDQCLWDARSLNLRLFGQINGVVPAGEVLTADIRLKDAAGVHVRVVADDGTAAPYAEVSLTTESIPDDRKDDNKAGEKRIADENGVIDFFPVIEGRFSVSAGLSGTAARGRASGEVPVDPANGVVIPVTVTLGAVTSAAGEVIRADIFGTVEGTVFKADGTPLENPAQVRVNASGASLLTTSDSGGGYRLESVPGGWLQVEAFEPDTSRRGMGSGRIQTNGQIVTVPITLVGLGMVTGQVFRADSSRAVEFSDVILYPSGRFTDPLVSRTDARGGYLLPGVPIGEYTVKAVDHDSGLAGTAAGTLQNDGDTGTTDVFLEAVGSIAGVVYAAGVHIDAEGTPVDDEGNSRPDAPTVAGVTVTIKGKRLTQTVRTGSDGTFASGGDLPVGDYQLTVQTDTDGASAAALLAYEGQVAHRSMVLSGTGTVRGRVLASGCGAPVDTARVTLHSRSPFAPSAVTRFTGPDGNFFFDDVPTGDFSIAVEKTGEAVLGAAAVGRMVQDGQILDFIDGDEDPVHNAVCLQDSGRVTGRILRSDGITPAGGAIVEIVKGDVRIVRLASDDGAFIFTGLPLGRWRLSVLDPAKNGTAARHAELTGGERMVDLGVIVLDSQAPLVVSTSPEPDAVNVDPTVPIVVVFSEIMDAASISGETLQVTTNGTTIPGSIQMEETAVADVPVSKIIFTPANRLPDLRRIQVAVKGGKIGFQGEVLENGVRDAAGHAMAADTVYSFSTADTRPPELIGMNPADGAVNVSVDSVIRIEFSEPVDPSFISSFALKDGTGPVPGAVSVPSMFGGRVLVFTPETPLLPNVSYTAAVTGPFRDLAGNAMPRSEISAVFATVDTRAPVIAALESPEGTFLIHGGTVTVTAVSDDPADVDHIEFFLQGKPLSMISDAPYACPILLDPSLGNTVEVTAIAVDASGNRSTPAVLRLSVMNDMPPVVAVRPLAESRVNQGAAVTVEVEATDDAGLTRIALAANDGAIFSGQRSAAGDPDRRESFTFTVPAALPEGAPVHLLAYAEDSSGHVTFADPVTFTVRDRTAPEVYIASPDDHAEFMPGSEVAVSVRAEDVSGITCITLDTYGAVVHADATDFDPVSPATARFVFTIPQVAASAVPIVISASASDAAGNTSSAASVNVIVKDIVPPRVETVDPDGTSPVSVAANIRIAFSEPIDPETVTTDSFRVTLRGVSVPGRWVLIDENRTLIWVSDHGFQFGRTYETTLTADVTDMAGNALISHTGEFTVTNFGMMKPVPRDRWSEGEMIQIMAGGAVTEGVEAVTYLLNGLEIGTAAAPPFVVEHRVSAPAGPETEWPVGAEAAIGGTNLALKKNKTVVTASPESKAHAFLPEKAADGDTDGTFSGGSVAAILGDPRAWWSADAGRIAGIDRIVVHLNTECCRENNRFAVLVAAEPFEESDFEGAELPERYANAAVEIYRTGDAPDMGPVVLAGRWIGRYVCIVHLGDDFLGLAEVEIFERGAVISLPEVRVSVHPAGDSGK